MTYYLAKKLKDAGYPYKGIWRKYSKNEGNNDDLDLLFPCPTLSELIDECGKYHNGFSFRLEVISEDTWVASYTCPIEYEEDFYDISEEGETPEEAVANLWLELKRVDK